MSYLVVIATDENNKITRMNASDSLDDANAIASSTGGFVVPHPTVPISHLNADMVAKTVTEDTGMAIAKQALAEIARLEAFISERRKREALLGNAEAIAFIQGVEDDIAIERAKL
jgi:hypothetical protein